MTMKMTTEEFLDGDGIVCTTPDLLVSKMALDFEADVYLRMKELGMKQKDLAKALGVSPASISKTLSEDSNLTLKMMARIAMALDCEVSSPRLKSKSAK